MAVNKGSYVRAAKYALFDDFLIVRAAIPLAAV
jgi:hypothetical protein